MCHSQVYAANITRHRCITVCKHQIVQVYWDNLTISWQKEDFCRFAEMIKHRAQTDDFPDNFVSLRVNKVMVSWARADFYEFVDMILMGLFNLESALAKFMTPPTQPFQLEDKDTPHIFLN